MDIVLTAWTHAIGWAGATGVSNALQRTVGLGQSARVSERAQNDVVLLTAVARGERQALGALYDIYAPVMLALGVRILGERQEAEDVLQDVFMEIWRKAGHYDPRRGRVKTWFFVRMRSRCLDRLRSARITRRDPLPAGEISVAAKSEISFDSAVAREAVSGLPDKQREVLQLGYFQGLSSTQIAVRLDVPVGTVKSRTAAALARLRTTFGVGR